MRKLKESYLDGKQLYKAYFEMGNGASIVRLARWAIANSMAKPTKIARYNKEGLPCMGVWKAMWRWASLKENHPEAYQIFQTYVNTYGWLDDTDFPWPMGTVITLQDWNRFMLKKVKTAWQFAPNRHARFLRENGWV